jgi:hypothetical protein
VPKAEHDVVRNLIGKRPESDVGARCQVPLPCIIDEGKTDDILADLLEETEKAQRRAIGVRECPLAKGVERQGQDQRGGDDRIDSRRPVQE